MDNKQILKTVLRCDHFSNLSFQEGWSYLRKSLVTCNDCRFKTTCLCPFEKNETNFCSFGEKDY